MSKKRSKKIKRTKSSKKINNKQVKKEQNQVDLPRAVKTPQRDRATRVKEEQTKKVETRILRIEEPRKNITRSKIQESRRSSSFSKETESRKDSVSSRTVPVNQKEIVQKGMGIEEKVAKDYELSRKTNRIEKKNPARQNLGIIFVKAFIQILVCIMFYFVVYGIVTDYAGQSYDFAYQIFGNVCMDASSKQKVKINIPEAASLKQVANILATEGIIKNEYSFYIRGKLSTNDKRVILPGEYILRASDNYEEILNILTQNDNRE